MITRLIQNFTFDSEMRSTISLSNSAKIRLNTENPLSQKLQLKLQDDGTYPLDTGLYASTPILTANALNKWLKFEALVVEDPLTHLLDEDFTIRFKVKTTAGNYYWTGTAWATAGANNWCTEAELNTNLSTFPIATVGNKGIGFVVNIQTDDPTKTPEVIELKLVGEFEIEFLDDIIYDSVVRKLNTEFRSTSVLRFQNSGSVAISSINLSTVLENKGYNVTGIRRVTNVTDDSMALTNLYQSYAQGAVKRDGFTFAPGTVTFTGTVAVGKVIEVIFEYVPEIVIRQNQDFYEVATFPSLVIERINDIGSLFNMRARNGNGLDYVRDKAALTAVVVRSPTQQTLKFEYAVFTNSQTDQIRLMDDLNRFMSRETFVTSYGLGWKYSLQVMEKLNTTDNNKGFDSTDTNIASGSFNVLGVLFYHQPAEDQRLIAADGLKFTYSAL